MARLLGTLAGLLMLTWLAGPAAANTIATFSIDGSFFAGGTAQGTFSIDLTTQKFTSVSITTTSGAVVPGATYPGFSIDTYAVETVGGSSAVRLKFYNSATALPPLSGEVLTLLMPVFDAASLASLPHFSIQGNESVYFFLCGGLCAERQLFAGIDTLSLTTTPIPAALPLLATALGGIGVLGWRRRRRVA